MKQLISFLTVLFLMISAKQVYPQDSTSAVNIDPNVVIEKYIDAIGGRDALSKVEDRTTIMRGTAMGQNLTITVKQKAPNKMRQDVKAGGMEQVVIFDGDKAVMTAMGQKIPVEDKELESLKIEADMNFILNPAKFNITISSDGIEKVNDKDAYKIKMQTPSGTKWYSYFDAESGLKVKELRELETKMGPAQQVTIYGDYKDVDGVKYPFKITQSFGPQTVEMTVSSIKVNKGLADDIFVIAE